MFGRDELVNAIIAQRFVSRVAIDPHKYDLLKYVFKRNVCQGIRMVNGQESIFKNKCRKRMSG